MRTARPSRHSHSTRSVLVAVDVVVVVVVVVVVIVVVIVVVVVVVVVVGVGVVVDLSGAGTLPPDGGLILPPQPFQMQDADAARGCLPRPLSAVIQSDPGGVTVFNSNMLTPPGLQSPYQRQKGPDNVPGYARAKPKLVHHKMAAMEAMAAASNISLMRTHAAPPLARVEQSLRSLSSVWHTGEEEDDDGDGNANATR